MPTVWGVPARRASNCRGPRGVVMSRRAKDLGLAGGLALCVYKGNKTPLMSTGG